MPLNKVFLLLLTTCTVACQQQAETVVQTSPATDSGLTDSAIIKTAPELPKTSSIISGYWLSSQYWKVVERTRSPAKAFGSTPPGPSSIYIEPFANQIDSVGISVTYGLHEGGDLVMLPHSGRDSNILPLYQHYGFEKGTKAELTYQISATDTTLLFITRNTKTNRIIDKIPYRRVLKPGSKTDLNKGVEWSINKLLIAGQYQGIDSIGQLVNARFSTDGTVTGLPFSKYLIQVDFTGPNPGDEVIFDVYSEQQRSFGASFGRDTLSLYTIHERLGVAPGETDTTELFSRGRLRYQLIRVRKP